MDGRTQGLQYGHHRSCQCRLGIDLQELIIVRNILSRCPETDIGYIDSFAMKKLVYTYPESHTVDLQEESMICASKTSGDYGVNDIQDINEEDISGLWNN